MRGLELSKTYFEEHGKRMIEADFSGYKQYMAAGLVGEGSECFGYDDELSQDHDFGPGFCIWLPADIYKIIGSQLWDAYNRLPENYKGFDGRRETDQASGRVGIFDIDSFYNKYTNCGAFPKDNVDWFKIPERFLATATNGEVFCDHLGEFTKARKVLKAFYPQDVLRKKLAARAAVMAQSGQYNYGRCTKRGDFRAAYLACAEFIKTALSAIYLLNGQYMPFYKWAFKGAVGLEKLQEAVGNLEELTLLKDGLENQARKQWLIENVCIEIGRELNGRGFSHTKDAFLQSHCESIMAGIKDSRFRNLHVMADCD